MISTEPDIITPRWYPLQRHPVQLRLMQSPARFKVVPAGRRSGKTERAKRKLVRTALSEVVWPDARFFAGAPTRDQAKRIWWNDLKALSPREFIEDIREGDLMIKYINGASLWVVGMDKPERIEGQPWNGGVLDEYANMKKQAWGANVRPALADRKGWCWLIGVPEGRNHYYDLYEKVVNRETGFEDWEAFTWKSTELDHIKDEAEAARKEMDELTYQQEFEASFVNFQGRVYYVFDRDKHCDPALQYNPQYPLIFCFDFNVSPGVAVICQELPELPKTKEPGTAVIGEVWIPRNSNTAAVCRKLVADWGKHPGEVKCYGDATGGADKTSALSGNDWDLIRRYLRQSFGERLAVNVPSANPSERSRVNALNSRMLSTTGEVRLMVNSAKAPHVVKDLEGVRMLEGGSGEIDDKADSELTHISDALGYYIVYKYPVRERQAEQREFGI